MIIEFSKIKKNVGIEKVLKKLAEKRKSKSSRRAKFFGSLKRGLDGVQYQKTSRNEWN